MPAIGVTTGVPSAAAMSWPWWMWPVRPAPNRESSAPKLNGPWTGKSFEPVELSAAGGAGAGAGAAFATTVSGWRKYCLVPRIVTTSRAV